MVLRADSGRGMPEATRRCKVKLEVEDSARDEFQQSLNKRAKLAYSLFHQEWDTGSSSTFLEPAQCNPLEEPSPLGLHLRKSPSLLDLIQMRLSQGNSVSTGPSNCENLNAMKKKDVKSLGGAAASEKLKASNFPVSLLRIGDWECVSRYEGDLVAKCYFAKQKLVWEVLDCGLKNKIEIQWSDIRAIKATFPENAPAILDIVLARQPLFFKETNPQPRKHTLWQATADFTGGQASMHRRHFLQCPQGLLNKHFEKLVQCDPRLNLLSQQPEMALDSPYFETKTSIFEDPDESKPHDFDHLRDEYVSTFPGFHGAGSPCTSQSASSITEIQDQVYKTPEAAPAPSATASSSVDFEGVEEIGGSERKELKSPVAFSQFKVPGLRSSMSVSDLVSHIGNRISEQMTAGHPFLSPKGEEGSCSKDMLEEITQYLLSDSQFQSASDEQCLMSRVNSLFCLLQKDATAVQNWQIKSEDETNVEPTFVPRSSVDAQVNLLGSQLECKQQPPAMSRKDSLGDLLLHLPRIASLPQFLFNRSEENDNQAR